MDSFSSSAAAAAAHAQAQAQAAQAAADQYSASTGLSSSYGHSNQSMNPYTTASSSLLSSQVNNLSRRYINLLRLSGDFYLDYFLF